MKNMLIALLVMTSFNVAAATKCETSPTGGVCCWDTNRDGIFRPIGC